MPVTYKTVEQLAEDFISTPNLDILGGVTMRCPVTETLLAKKFVSETTGYEVYITSPTKNRALRVRVDALLHKLAHTYQVAIVDLQCAQTILDNIPHSLYYIVESIELAIADNKTSKLHRKQAKAALQIIDTHIDLSKWNKQ